MMKTVTNPFEDTQVGALLASGLTYQAICIYLMLKESGVKSLTKKQIRAVTGNNQAHFMKQLDTLAGAGLVEFEALLHTVEVEVK